MSPTKLLCSKMISPAKDFASPSNYFRSPAKRLNDDADVLSPTSLFTSPALKKLPIPRHTTPRRTPGGNPKGVLRSPMQDLQQRGIEYEPGMDSFLTFVQSLSPLIEVKSKYELGSPLGTKATASAPHVRRPQSSIL